MCIQVATKWNVVVFQRGEVNLHPSTLSLSSFPTVLLWLMHSVCIGQNRYCIRKTRSWINRHSTLLNRQELSLLIISQKVTTDVGNHNQRSALKSWSTSHLIWEQGWMPDIGTYPLTVGQSAHLLKCFHMGMEKQAGSNFFFLSSLRQGYERARR